MGAHLGVRTLPLAALLFLLVRTRRLAALPRPLPPYPRRRSGRLRTTPRRRLSPPCCHRRPRPPPAAGEVRTRPRVSFALGATRGVGRRRGGAPPRNTRDPGGQRLRPERRGDGLERIERHARAGAPARRQGVRRHRGHGLAGRRQGRAALHADVVGSGANLRGGRRGWAPARRPDVPSPGRLRSPVPGPPRDQLRQELQEGLCRCAARRRPRPSHAHAVRAMPPARRETALYCVVRDAAGTLGGRSGASPDGAGSWVVSAGTKAC